MNKLSKKQNFTKIGGIYTFWRNRGKAISIIGLGGWTLLHWCMPAEIKTKGFQVLLSAWSRSEEIIRRRRDCVMLVMLEL